MKVCYLWIAHTSSRTYFIMNEELRTEELRTFIISAHEQVTQEMTVLQKQQI